MKQMTMTLLLLVGMLFVAGTAFAVLPPDPAPKPPKVAVGSQSMLEALRGDLKQIGALGVRIEKLDVKITRLNAEIAVLDEIINDPNSSDELKAWATAQKDKKVANRDAASSLKTDLETKRSGLIEEVQQGIGDMKNLLQAKIEVLNAKLAPLQRRASELDAEITVIEKAQENLPQNSPLYKKLEARKQALLAELRNVNEKIGHLQPTKDKLEGRVAVLDEMEQAIASGDYARVAELMKEWKHPSAGNGESGELVAYEEPIDGPRPQVDPTPQTVDGTPLSNPLEPVIAMPVARPVAIDPGTGGDEPRMIGGPALHKPVVTGKDKAMEVQDKKGSKELLPGTLERREGKPGFEMDRPDGYYPPAQGGSRTTPMYR